MQEAYIIYRLGGETLDEKYVFPMEKNIFEHDNKSEKKTKIQKFINYRFSGKTFFGKTNHATYPKGCYKLGDETNSGNIIIFQLPQ